MSLAILKADLSHIEQLLALYQIVYGKNYPLAFSQDPALMRSLLSSSHVLWLITQDTTKGVIVGTLLFHIDPTLGMCKLEGVVVHPLRRGENIASNMIKLGLEQLLAGDTIVDSVYTTTRTVSLGPQQMCLSNGFIPIGILPNSRKLVEYETLTLMAVFREGLLAQRSSIIISAQVLPLQRALNHTLGITGEIACQPMTPMDDREAPKLHFEFITAAAYVDYRFHLATSSDPYGAFYPFHRPNTLIVDHASGIEVFAYICEADKYCTIISCSCPVASLGRGLGGLVERLNAYGVTYIETLVDLEMTAVVDTLIASQFLPSAIYPAMYHTADGYHDFLLLCRCTEPLNFKDIVICDGVKPYVEQYAASWRAAFLPQDRVG